MGSPNPLFLRDDELDRGIELLYVAHRAYTAAPDDQLTELGLGRAHYRVLYFVGRRPDITLAELIELLRASKQSLSRVLRQLVAAGYVEQRQSDHDRRQRLLRLTDAGVALFDRLNAVQRQRMAAAYRAAGAEAVAGYRRVLRGLIEAPAAPQRRAG